MSVNIPQFTSIKFIAHTDPINAISNAKRNILTSYMADPQLIEQSYKPPLY